MSNADATRPTPPRALERRLLAARLALFWERTWPALWPTLGVAGAFLALALFDLPPLAAFLAHARFFDPPLEVVHIPFEGKEIIGYLRLPKNAAGPVPLVPLL